MKLSEYDDEDLIEEIKHRGIKIEVKEVMTGYFSRPAYVIIGGVEFVVTQ